MSKTNIYVKISVLAAMAIILMQIKTPLVMFFPEFLKLDVSDLPALIGGFAMGPLAGIAIVFFKNLVHGLIGTQTLWVGEFANFLVGASLVGVSSMVYSKVRTLKGALGGLFLGTIVMAIVGGLTNYYILIPLYGKVMGWSVDAFVGLGSKLNPMIKDIGGYILLIIVPFNLLKGVLVSTVTVFVYKPMAKILKAERRKLDREIRTQ